jgi:hypothetical protein
MVRRVQFVGTVIVVIVVVVLVFAELALKVLAELF